MHPAHPPHSPASTPAPMSPPIVASTNPTGWAQLPLRLLLLCPAPSTSSASPASTPYCGNGFGFCPSRLPSCHLLSGYQLGCLCNEGVRLVFFFFPLHIRHAWVLMPMCLLSPIILRPKVRVRLYDGIVPKMCGKRKKLHTSHRSTQMQSLLIRKSKSLWHGCQNLCKGAEVKRGKRNIPPS